MTHSLSLAMQQYGVELRARKYVKGYGFLSFAWNIYVKQLLLTKCLYEIKFEFLRNKIADVVTKLNNDKIAKKVPVEKIIIPP